MSGPTDTSAAIDRQYARRDIQIIGEQTEFVIGHVRRLRVVADQNLVAPFALRVLMDRVRIIGALGDPQPAAGVEAHRNRLDDLRLGGKEINMESLGQMHVGDRIGRTERFLHL